MFASFRAHSTPLTQIVALTNGNFVTAANETPIKVWNSANLSMTLVYSSHSSGVTSLAYIDADTIASSSWDSTIQLWSPITGVQKVTITVDSQALCLTYLGNGKLVSGHVNGSVFIWNVSTGVLLGHLVGHLQNVLSLELVDNQTLASSSQDTTIIIWNLNIMSLRYNLTGHTSAVFGLRMLSDNILASGSADKTVRVWNVATRQQMFLLNGHADAIYWSVDTIGSDFLISGSIDQTIKFWRISTGFQLTFTLNVSLEIRALAVAGSK